MICIDNLKSVLVESENENKLPLRLHDAARKYDCKELKRLIQNGCDPNAQVRDTKETVLHLLVKDGFRGHLNLEKMEECLEYMVSIPNIHLDIPDKNGETPLTLAVANEFENCAFLLVKYGAKTSISSPTFNGMFHLPIIIAQTMPNVMLEALNSGVSLDLTSNGEPSKVKVDFSPLLQLEEQKESSAEDKSMRRFKYHQRETSFLYSFLDVPPNIRVDYLNHPLVSAYLHLKKNTISKKLRWFTIILGTYPIFYMAFIYFLYFDRCKFLRYDDSLPTSENNSTTEPPHKQMCYKSTPVSVAAYLLAFVAGGFALVEVYMQLRVDTKYLKNWRTWVIRVTLVIMAITLWPALQFGTMYDITWQYPIAAVREPQWLN